MNHATTSTETRTMTTARTVPTAADLDALMPALHALARTTPFGFARFATGGGQVPEARIELPTPGGSPITVAAHVAYGSRWQVEISGASFNLASPDDARTLAGVLQVAHGLAALLAAIPSA